MSHKRESHLSIHIEDILLKRNSIIGREASQDLRDRRLQGRELLTVHVNRISIEPTRNLKIFKNISDEYRRKDANAGEK